MHAYSMCQTTQVRHGYRYIRTYQDIDTGTVQIQYVLKVIFHLTFGEGVETGAHGFGPLFIKLGSNPFIVCDITGDFSDYRRVQYQKVEASFTNNGITVSAWLHFNDEGALINFISQDRYSADAGKQLPWATPLKDYQQINGYNLMRNAEAIYSYPDRGTHLWDFQTR